MTLACIPGCRCPRSAGPCAQTRSVRAYGVCRCVHLRNVRAPSQITPSDRRRGPVSRSHGSVSARSTHHKAKGREQDMACAQDDKPRPQPPVGNVHQVPVELLDLGAPVRRRRARRARRIWVVRRVLELGDHALRALLGVGRVLVPVDVVGRVGREARDARQRHHDWRVRARRRGGGVVHGECSTSTSTLVKVARQAQDYPGRGHGGDYSFLSATPALPSRERRLRWWAVAASCGSGAKQST
jgi:hypothetical protein